MPARTHTGLPRGIWTALVTPFCEDGSVDFEAFRNLVQRQINAGIHALVPCGSTGEAATLSDFEKIELVKICIELSRNKIPVIAGAGNNDTSKAIALHKQMKNSGATAALHVTPYYNRPTQEGLYRHFCAIAESSDLPMVLYNVPSRTGVDLASSTTLRLAKDLPQVVAIKETSTDTARIQNLISELKSFRPDFLVLSGEDAFLLPLLALGGHGLISVGSNLAPDTFCSVFEHVHLNQLEKAQSHFAKIAQLTPLMFMSSNPIPVKTALSFLDLIKNCYRLPLCPMDSDQTEQLRVDLIKQGWL